MALALDAQGVLPITGVVGGVVDFGANIVRGNDQDFYAAFRPEVGRCGLSSSP